MNSNVPLPPRDLLARAEAALREAPGDEGPSTESLARTVAALRAAESAPPVVAPRPSRVMLRYARIAAAITVAATAVFGVSEWGRLRPTAVFAQMAQKLHDAQTLVYRLRIDMPEIQQSQIEKVFSKGRDRWRTESETGLVVIFDRNQGKILTLDPKSKTAKITGLKGGKPANPADGDEDDFMQVLRNLTKAEAQPAGSKEVAGRQAKGFRAKLGKFAAVIWVDARADEPLAVELSTAHGVKLTLSDFELNRPLDDNLFSVEAPEGYQVENARLYANPEEALARWLRAYVEASDKAFPPHLDDWVAFAKRLHEAREKSGNQPQADEFSPEEMQQVADSAIVGGYFMVLKQGYVYQPEGAKLGDAKRMLFWYRPSETEKYRALYADLHWSDVAADQLPKRPNNP